MATQPKTFITPEEYLKRDRAAEIRSEYLHGEMFEVQAATAAHALIVLNLGGELRSAFRNRDCIAYASSLRVLVGATKDYTYPDLAIVCGKPLFADGDNDTLTNPAVIIEVISESTADYDLGGKFHLYRQIPTLQEYLTVAQTEMSVDHWVRQPDNSWLVREIGPSIGCVTLASVDVTLKFAEIYEKVTFADKQ